MNEKTNLPSFEDEIRAEMSAPAASAEFVLDLKSRLEDRIQHPVPVHPAAKPQSWTQRPKPRPFYLQPRWAVPAVVIVLLLVTLLAVGPQRALAAVRGLLGYIPDVGVVSVPGSGEGSSLRVLAEPASLERAGITLQVQEGAADDTRTILVYQADGLSVEASNSQGEGARTGGIAVLALSDGSVLTLTSAEMKGWGTGYQARLVFPPLPPDVTELTLVIERLVSMPAGAAPEDWRIPLAFEPAPSDITMLPVYELTAQETQPAVETIASDEEPGVAMDAPHGIQISLDRVVETENGFLLQGHTNWEGRPYTWVSNYETSLADAQGNPIPFEWAQADYSAGPVPENSTLWALQTNNKAYPGPWTLIVNSVQVHRAVDDPAAAFEIDFGPAAQIGQTWQLDQAVQAAGFSLRAVSASLHEEKHMGIINPVLEIVVETDVSLVDFGLDDPLNRPEEGQSAGAGLGWTDLETTKRSSVIGYYEIPSGQRSLRVLSISYILNASWQASWTPPAVSGEAAVPEPEQACLTAEAWREAVEQPAALPVSLSGRLLVEQNTGQLMPQMYLVDLDGNIRQDLVIGGWSSLSPDGATAAYIESDGPALMLLDVAAEQTRQVPGSTPEDYHPVWSPDGQWLAFVRSNDGIYISRTDGSERRQVADASKIRFLVGWLPDNRRLVMTSLEIDGSQVQVLDTHTGEIQDQFIIEQVKGGFVRLSPDGNRVAYSELVFGTTYYSIYLSNLDGSGKRLAVALGGGVTSGAWSPDGQWLALTVSSKKDSLELQTTAILQPDTCQVIPLAGVEGQIVSWVNLP